MLAVKSNFTLLVENLTNEEILPSPCVQVSEFKAALLEAIDKDFSLLKQFADVLPPQLCGVAYEINKELGESVMLYHSN